MFEEFENFIAEVAESESDSKDLNASKTFHVVETDDPENIQIVGGVPEYWAQVLDSQQGDNLVGMKENCGLVSVSNVERMAGHKGVTETGTCILAVATGNCAFNLFDIEGSGGVSPEKEVALLDMANIPAKVYTNEVADPEKIAEWVENGHGVIFNHSACLSSDERVLHMTVEEATQIVPQVSRIGSLPEGTVITLSAEGVEATATFDGYSVHLDMDEIPGLDTGLRELLPPGVSLFVSNEGVDIRITGEALENEVTMDEYGNIYADHAITVTGTVRDMNGELLGLRVCDSGWGDASGCDRFISMEQLDRCYTDTVNGSVVVTDNPVHCNGIPLKQATL